MTELSPARRVAAQLFISLDGVIQAPGARSEDADGGFPHGGWSMTYWDEPMDRAMAESTAQGHELVLGRRTYEIFANYWPAHDDHPIGAVLNRSVKHVASRTLKTLAWANSRLLPGDAVPAVRALKAERGPPLSVIGSAHLLQSLLRADLVDELELWTFPVVLGTGKRLFGDGVPPTAWTLARSATSSTGVRMDLYSRSGKVRYGHPPE